MLPLIWISVIILVALIATLIVVVHFARRSARRHFLTPSEVPSVRHRALWGYAGRDPSFARRSAPHRDAPDPGVATNGYTPELPAPGRASRRAQD